MKLERLSQINVRLYIMYIWIQILLIFS